MIRPEQILKPHRWLPTTFVLLLMVFAVSARATADSPRWADERMLLLWPEALGGTLPEETVPRVSEDQQAASGRVTITDADLEQAVAAVGDEPSPAVVPAGIITPSHQEVRPVYVHPVPCADEDWHLLPAGMLYKSYIAGEKEPRMAAAYLHEKDRGSVFEATIGGRLGLVRYGTPGAHHPEGIQWDLEGAAMLRQDIEQELDVEAVDFRVGSVLTWRRGPTAVKGGYYHLSSHLGDEFLLRNPGFNRLNYVRDALLIGVHHHVRPDTAIYGEVAYSVKTDGGAEPLELQFGFEYTPLDASDAVSAPIVAVNAHLREEFDFGGGVNVIAGWEWRGRHSNRRLRIGGQYYNGKEIQWSFFNESVEFAGVGIWYDF